MSNIVVYKIIYILIRPVLRAKNGEIFPYDNIRLPGAISPKKYAIRMETNMTDFAFGGVVLMLLEVSFISLSYVYFLFPI